MISYNELKKKEKSIKYSLMSIFPDVKDFMILENYLENNYQILFHYMVGIERNKIIHYQMLNGVISPNNEPSYDIINMVDACIKENKN